MLTLTENHPIYQGRVIRYGNKVGECCAAGCVEKATRVVRFKPPFRPPHSASAALRSYPVAYCDKHTNEWSSMTVVAKFVESSYTQLDHFTRDETLYADFDPEAGF